MASLLSVEQYVKKTWAAREASLAKLKNLLKALGVEDSGVIFILLRDVVHRSEDLGAMRRLLADLKMTEKAPNRP